MVCRNPGGHDGCTKGSPQVIYQDKIIYKDPPPPDNTNYNIVDVQRIGPHLVLKVQYPYCKTDKNCSFEGNKVMVFLNVSEVEVLRWRKIDPHFRPTGNVPTEAPSPAARFPATENGWKDALDYANTKILRK